MVRVRRRPRDGRATARLSPDVDSSSKLQKSSNFRYVFCHAWAWHETAWEKKKNGASGAKDHGSAAAGGLHELGP